MISVTVTEIVDIAARSGDIGGRASGVTVEEGVLAHKRVEDGRCAMAEVPLSFEFESGGVEYHIDGRADLIYTGEEYDTVEELKTVPGTFFGGNGAIPQAHIAQGVLYAFMWCRGTGQRRAAVRITYVPKSAGRERSFECVFSREELEAEAMAIISRWERFAHLTLEKKSKMPQAIKKLRFPYGGAREGQTEFMTAVMRACRRGGRVMIQAPTGTGKTMAALYPSVKAVGEGFVDRVFYLTAKTSTRLAAEDASSALCARTDHLRAITILARERMCADGHGDGEYCRAECCEYANGHYDRAADAVWELVAEVGAGKCITPELTVEVAKRHRVCPYELSLDAAEMCDIIICDFNYVFDPRVYLRRFFGADSVHKSEKYALLCDEAHNLVDRAREMYSASLSRSAVTAAKEASRDDDVKESLALVEDAIGKASAMCEDVTVGGDGEMRGFYVCGEPFSAVAKAAEEASAMCGREAFLMRGGESGEERRAAKILSRVKRMLSDFAVSADMFDRRHTAFVEMRGGDVICTHMCLDASAHLDERMRRASAVVMFSATLEPPDYFARVLGCGECETLELPSPYKRDNLCILAADKLSTRMADRAATAGEIAELIEAVVKAKVGNYICYLPSYSYLELLRGAFGDRSGVEVVVQKQHMSERERQSFIDEFTESPKVTKVGFCVLGGVFSEGVDLPGDRLSGVIVVGVGMPQLSTELNLLRDYYERICERGFEFAYVFPGMNKVLQAAGRVIRSESDRGVVLLVDDRFGTAQYRALFPSHWQNMRYVGDRRAVMRVLDDFWREKQRSDEKVSQENSKTL